MEGRIRTGLMTRSRHLIPELDGKGLRDFGLTIGGIVAGLLGGLLPWLFGLPFPVWPWFVGGGLVLWALLAPTTLRPAYRLWMQLGLLLNRITTPLIMGIVFFLLFVPIGLLMRLMKRDPMARQLDAEKITTFRVISRKAPKENMEKPF